MHLATLKEAMSHCHCGLCAWTKKQKAFRTRQTVGAYWTRDSLPQADRKLARLGRLLRATRIGRHIYVRDYGVLLYYYSPNVARKSSHVGSRLMPCRHRAMPLMGSVSPPAANALNVLKPQATHLARPPAVYCVTE